MAAIEGATVSGGAEDAGPKQSSHLAPFPTAEVMLLASVMLVGLTALNARYGFHGDEMYLSWLGAHPAWGYVASAQPPVVPIVAHLVDSSTGESLVAMRFLGALVVAILVVGGALLAREFGGSRQAQALAALAMACIPAVRGPSVIWTAVAADMVVWTVVLLLSARLLRTGDPTLWLWLGLAVGIGFQMKWTVGLLVVGLGLGLLLTPHRAMLWTPLLPAGVVIALGLWAPNLWWHATHDWPFLDYSESVSDKNDSIEKRLLFFPLVAVLLTGLLAAPIALRGSRWLYRSCYRPLGLAAPLIVFLVFAAGGRTYFVAPLAVLLFAAGAVATDRMGDRQRRRALWMLALTGLLTLPITSPVLPPRLLNAVKPINPYMLDMIGWPELVAQVQTATRSIPPGERERTIVLAENFATASALKRYAPELVVYSPQHDYWYLGPPPEGATTVLTVGYGHTDVSEWCAGAKQVGSVENDHDVDNAQEGWPLLLCRRLRNPWSTVWNGIRSYG